MITKKDVEHIGHLARIELAGEEVERLEKDLSGILDFVNQLGELDTSAVLPLAGGLSDGLLVSFEDETRKDDERELPLGRPAELVDAAPKREKEWVEVKSVFG